MRMQRTARQHTTLQATAGVNSEDYFDFRPKQRVMTADGYPGRVEAVHDGPHAGSEAYEVVLDGGMGGGLYASSQLHALADDAHTAAGDYPELEDVLSARPDPAKQVVMAKKAARKRASTLPDDHPDKVYLRFGHWPKNERSANGVTGHPEDGVSVYDLDHKGEPMDPDPNLSRGHEHDESCDPDCDLDSWNEDYGNDTREEMNGRVYRAEKARANGHDYRGEVGHLVKGKMTGIGHDGEPLLNNVKRVGDWIDHRHMFIPTASPHRLARGEYDEDYEPPSSKLATTQNGTRIDGHGEAPHEVRAKDPNGYDAKSTEGDPDPLMSKPLTKKDEVGAHGGELGKGMSGVSFEGAMSPMQKQKIEDREDARQDVVDQHSQVNDARRDRTDVGDVQRVEDPAYAKYLQSLNALTVRADWDDPEHGAEWRRPWDVMPVHHDDGRWHDPELDKNYEHDTAEPEADDSSTAHAAHLHLPNPEEDPDALASHMVDAHGYDLDKVKQMMMVHRLMSGQHEMDHETEPGGMGLHPDDFSLPHDHPDRWLEHGSIPGPEGGVEQAGARGDTGHALDSSRPFELKPWHMNYSLSSLADPYALVASAAQDRDLGFQLTAAWTDVRNKAKRIRSEGKVRITLASDGLVAGEVQGDHQTYETGIQRLPGSRHGVATWSCGCKWGAYHWGASDDFSRFAGRMCSHALALQYEAQSRGMFGKTVEVDTSKPDWVPPRVVVKYNPDTGHSDFAKSSSLVTPELSPLQIFCAYAGNDGETADQITCLLHTAGLVEGYSNSPWGEPIAEVPPKPYGATQPANKWEDPGSAGFLATPDPEDWGGLGQNNQMYSTSSLDEAVFEPVLASPQGAYEDQDSPADPEGLEATLHDTPEPALPETDGGREDMVGEHAEDLTPDDQSMMTVGNQMGGADEVLDETQNTTPQDLDDVVARFQASAGAKAIMADAGTPSGPAAREGASAAPSDGDIAAHARQVLALKAFSPAEQASLINEGVGERAANFDKLDIAGTHYADLDDEDDTWLS
jgi:hypothetical protein